MQLSPHCLLIRVSILMLGFTWHYILFSLGLRNNVPWRALNSTRQFCYCIPFVNTPNDSRFGTVSSFTHCPAELLVTFQLWMSIYELHFTPCIKFVTMVTALYPSHVGGGKSGLVSTVSQLVRWFIIVGRAWASSKLLIYYFVMTHSRICHCRLFK